MGTIGLGELRAHDSIEYTSIRIVQIYKELVRPEEGPVIRLAAAQAARSALAPSFGHRGAGATVTVTLSSALLHPPGNRFESIRSLRPRRRLPAARPRRLRPGAPSLRRGADDGAGW